MDQRSRVVLYEPKEHIRELIIFNLELNFNFDVIEAYSDQEFLTFLEMDKDIILAISDIDTREMVMQESYGLLKNQGRDVPIIGTGEKSEQIFDGIDNQEQVMIFPKKGCILPIVKYIKQICHIDDSVTKLEYTRLAMKTLTHFQGLSNDLFIRLGTEDKHRYIKYFSQGDRVTMEDVERKREKGVEHLFIKKLAAKWILITVDENMEQIAVSDDGDFLIDMSHVDTESEEADKLLGEILNELDEEEGDEEEFEDIPIPAMEKREDAAPIKEEVLVLQEYISKNLQLEDRFVNQVHAMTKKSLEKVKKMPKLDKFLKKVQLNRTHEEFFNNRLNLIINVSCAIARTLDWGTEATLEKLIFTAYVHDCLLVDRPHLAKIKDMNEFEKIKNKLSEEDKKTFLDHPKMTEKMLTQRGDIAPDICSMVLQHHELPDKSGFPEKLNGQRIIPMASLFIVAIDLASYISEDDNWDMDTFLEKTKEKYTGQNFRRVMGALEKVAKKLRQPKASAA